MTHLMSQLLELVQTGKLHWLTVPRYAVIALPVVLAGAVNLAGCGEAALLPLSVSALGVTRLVWLKRLPHEKVRLVAAENALATACPDQAIEILQPPLLFAGTHYQVERAALLTVAYVRNGQYVEAHRALNAVNEQHLWQDERLSLLCAWSWLFLEAGNPTEALRRLEEVPQKECIGDTRCLLLKAELKLQHSSLTDARTLLEGGLDRYEDAAQRILLLNNLARLEGLQGRFDAQLRYLQSALREFRCTPRADLADVVHHNLAIALVRAGRRDEARAVLREAWVSGDSENLRHAIAALNNALHAAREAGDADWTRDVHQEFQRQLSRLEPRTQRERLALDVSQLRARRNDEFSLESGDYLDLISQLLNHLDSSAPAIPGSDCVAALVEIRHDLKQEFRAAHNRAKCARLPPLAERAVRLLINHRPTIDAHLGALSPKLLGPLEAWHRYRTDSDKAQIELADSAEARRVATAHLFTHLREKAEWLEEQGTARHSIEAWLVICDEYLAYHRELPAAETLCLRDTYLQSALDALDCASMLFEHSKVLNQDIDHIIGVAYFNLQLREDAAAAAHWMRIVEAQKPELAHFAGWLREHYAYVCTALRTESTSSVAHHC